jgi:hypothetical protein
VASITATLPSDMRWTPRIRANCRVLSVSEPPTSNTGVESIRHAVAGVHAGVVFSTIVTPALSRVVAAGPDGTASRVPHAIATANTERAIAQRVIMGAIVRETPRQRYAGGLTGSRS